MLACRFILFGFWVLFGAFVVPRAIAGDPFVDAVKAVETGANAGFGADKLPRRVFGAPRGRGLLVGSTHVYSLGNGGSITVAFNDNIVIDGPGADLAIYENAFHVGGEEGPLFTEYAIVEVSDDNRTWHRFPFNAETGTGLAGRTAVTSNPANGMNPLDPSSGGDRFDLADLGLEMIRFVRVIDGGSDIPDFGNMVAPGTKGGFDLDAMAAINGSAPANVHGVVSDGGEPVAGARVRLVPLDGSRKKRRFTDSEGRYRFGRVLPVGDHEVRVRVAGVGSATRSAYVDLQQLSAEIDLVLQ